MKWAKKSQGGLVLQRREGDTILINHGELRIELVEVRGKYVRLAFIADKEIKIDRVDKEACNSANAEGD